jgi:hypothetical protein
VPRKPLLRPDYQFTHVQEITVAFLREKKIRGVICDLDNTLVPWHSEEAPEAVQRWIDILQDASIAICIASNTHNLRRLSRITEKLNIVSVSENARKPSTYGLERAISQMGVEKQETAMIGDQLFTDMVAGNRLGIVTILINPLSSHEFIGTRLISRPAERLFLRGRYARP